MCGIAGIWQLDGRPVTRDRITRFVRALAHRGPDGEGVLIDDDACLALGHRRLTILDLTDAGAQPMRSASGRYDITYNGEIYNFVELRTELASEGWRFHTDTDTEVLLAAFEHWGAACLRRFNGMWAFAIWDRRDRRLLLARDRFGVKPLYLALDDSRVAFASELKAFLHLDGFVPAANEEAVAARLAGTFHRHVLLRGVEAVPPGWCVEVTTRGVRRWRWWRTLDHLVAVPRDPVEQAEQFRALLVDACRLRLRSDVPLATSLSGGLDSSSVLAALACAGAADDAVRQAPDWRRAFIAGFPGTTQDETADALLAAKQAGARPILHEFPGEVSPADIEAYLYQFEEIVGLFGLPSWALYREMRRSGVRISIDGHGGDELLGGYPLHLVLALIGGPGPWRDPWRTIDLAGTWRHMLRMGPAAGRVRSAAMALMARPAALAAGRRLPVVRERLRTILRLSQQYHVGADEPAGDDAQDEAEALDALGPLTRVLYRSFHDVSLPRILRAFDAHAMGHGVEVRMPLLDWRLVCFAFSVPDASKVGGGYAKRLLRDAMGGALPDRVRLRRDKVSYVAPVARWLDGGLRDWVWDAVNAPGFLQSAWWDGPALRALTAERRRAGSWRRDDAAQVLLAVAAHWWLTRWLTAGSRTAAVTAGR